MAKILVQTPVTSNGRDVVLDGEGKVKYKDTIVEAAAKPAFVRLNKTLPPVLQYKISDYVEPAVKQKANATA